MTSVVGARTAPVVGMWLAAGIGLAAGLLGGLFGVGGGLIIVPCLIAFAAMDRRLAHGTSLAATLPIAGATLVTYLWNGHVDWPVAAILTVGSVIGAIVGTALLRVLSKRVLAIIFALTALGTAVRLFTTDEVTGRADLTFGMVIFLLAVGLIAGTLAGLLGIGGGVIMGPAMVVGLGIYPVVAKGTSAAVIVPTAIIGTLRNRKNANADIRAAMIIGGFGAISAVVGAAISNQLSDQLSNVLFGLLLVVVAISQLMTLRNSDTSSGPTRPVGAMVE